MKKVMIALTMMLLTAATGKAMSYEQARNEALFLTDKMAYELNLTDAQYEAAYEINLDYLMGVTCRDDVYGVYWERRNMDLSYILLDWQWEAFRAASYFFRPLYWNDGFWHFAVYARYPHRDYFYFGRPVFYATYRGGHAWHVVGGHGYYHSRRNHFRSQVGHHSMHQRLVGTTHHGGPRSSSTQSTVNRPSRSHHSSTIGSSSSGRGYSGSSHSSSFDRSSNGSTHSSGSFGRSSNGSSHSSGSFDRSSNSSSHSSGSLGVSSNRSSHSSGSFSSSSRGSGSFSSSSRGSGSFSSSSHSSGSFSRGGSSGGGRSSGGGHSFGGRR